MPSHTINLMYPLSPAKGQRRVLYPRAPFRGSMAAPGDGPRKLTVLIHGDAIAALDEQGRPLRAAVRPVLTTAKGGVVTLGKTWMGSTVVVVELAADKRPRKRGIE